MSMGKCFNYCKASYAFAVVQYQTCWCSNYIPAQQDSTGQCDQTCPGFPGDLCGNSNSALYGYIPLYNQPLGTAGAVSSAPPPASSAPVSARIPSAPYHHHTFIPRPKASLPFGISIILKPTWTPAHDLHDLVDLADSSCLS